MASTLHVVGLPHTETTDDFSWCAFTSLHVAFCKMMTRFGYEVILYAGHNNEAECAEHVKCHNSPKSTDFFVPPWTQEYFQPMNDRVIAAMKKRIKPGDLILLSMGVVQLPIQNAFPDNISVEFCVGYGGSTAPARVFPSWAWLHVMKGHAAGLRQENIMTLRGGATDIAIPHFLDPELFPKGNGGDYLLFVGRMGGMKGEQVAIQVSQETGIPLKLVGPDYHGDYGEYLGVVKPKERAELMGGALALIAPSQFPEPFGLVVIEAQMCGTPVITTDWGAFTETVEQNVTGYRCAHVKEFVNAVLRLHEQYIGTGKVIDREYIRQRALRLYSIDAVAPQYDAFFKRLEYIYPDKF